MAARMEQFTDDYIERVGGDVRQTFNRKREVYPSQVGIPHSWSDLGVDDRQTLHLKPAFPCCLSTSSLPWICICHDVWQRESPGFHCSPLGWQGQSEEVQQTRQSTQH